MDSIEGFLPNTLVRRFFTVPRDKIVGLHIVALQIVGSFAKYVIMVTIKFFAKYPSEWVLRCFK